MDICWLSSFLLFRTEYVRYIVKTKYVIVWHFGVCFSRRFWDLMEY